MCLLIEADEFTERAIARQLERYGCRVVEVGPTTLRAEFPDARTEREAVVETRLYLGPRISSVVSLRAA
ncbi:MAG TPA: hypothetical protein VJT84_11575 [Gaiellaceae bacterium]|nr:hypothetical protein [Gaiellaceae bacterium]